LVNARVHQHEPTEINPFQTFQRFKTFQPFKARIQRDKLV
jgi:hypothetical protein